MESLESSLSTKKPRHATLTESLREQIAAGTLPAGSRLPTFAQMRDQGLKQSVVEQAYMRLEQEGLIRRQAKRGVFVAEPGAAERPVLQVVLSEEMSRNPYYRNVLQGIYEEAHRQSADIRLEKNEAADAWDKVDGAILLHVNETVVGNVPENFPCVATQTQCLRGIPTVMSDDRTGIALSVEHLASLGHRRIGFLTLGQMRNAAIETQLRLMQYRSALLAADIDPEPAWVFGLRDSAYEPFSDFVELGRRKTAQWLESGWRETGCTALLAHNDETAIGSMQALEDAGYAVPEDVSVVGFDGIDAGRCVRPRLTTVRVRLEDIGATATSMLLEQIRGCHREKARTMLPSLVLPPELVVRESTARIR